MATIADFQRLYSAQMEIRDSDNQTFAEGTLLDLKRKYQWSESNDWIEDFFFNKQRGYAPVMINGMALVIIFKPEYKRKRKQ
jgi:hypothetical protein